MTKAVAACLAALVLCAGCILTEEDLDCWYDDMCVVASTPAPSR
jgi:hypothetical protein